MKILREALSLSWKAKGKFLGLIVLEAVFFSLVAALLFSYAAKAQHSMENVEEFLSQQQWLYEEPTEENLYKLNIPGTDLSVLERENSAIGKATRGALLWLAMLFIISRTISWTLSFSIAKKGVKRKDVLRYAFSSFIVLMTGTAVSLGAALWLLSTASGNAGADVSLVSFAFPLMILFLVLVTMPLCLALSGGGFRKVWRGMAAIIKRKLHWLAIAYFFIGAAALVPLVLLLVFLESAGLAMVMLALLFLMTTVFCRISLILFVARLVDE